ncbi:sulfatase [Sinorhizobium meliloti]|nr:sulfatase-like hydrolase/transferase [Sinorhizobium meliloti]
MKPKNLIFICTDQMRFDALSATGNKVVRTENIDRIASEGITLRRHHTPNQICSPSRASMATGLYPRHHGLWRNGVTLDPDLPNLWTLLSQAGYETHAVGKLHYQPLLASSSLNMPESIAFWDRPDAQRWSGPYYGFREVELVMGEANESVKAGHYAAWLKAHHPEAVRLYEPEASANGRAADLTEVWKSAVPQELHYTSWIAGRAVDFIREASANAPFCLYVSFPDPHHPFAPPAPYSDLFDPAEMPRPNARAGELDRMPSYLQIGDDPTKDAYIGDGQAVREQGFLLRTDSISERTMATAIAHTFGMIKMIDDCVGRILDALEQAGKSGDTYILFTSDHGELLGDHGLLRKGPPPYRQLLQVPLLVRGPKIPRGAVTDELTSHIDLFATFASLLVGEKPASDGMDLTPLLTGLPGFSRDYLFAEYHPRKDAELYNQTIVSKDWRFTRYPNRGEWGELFDLASDPFEHRNLFYDDGHDTPVRDLDDVLSRHMPPRPEIPNEVLGAY